MTDREKKLQAQNAVLVDRLTISLMYHGPLWQAIVLLDGRSDDRSFLREESGYTQQRRSVKRMLNTMEQKRSKESGQ